jgi:hydroxymethylpyrimidine pyrophosphatase-like HAD family hydrolase
LRYFAVAFDYDGTLATAGAVEARTREALERLERTGRRVFLVTGRVLADLQKAFPALDLFDRVVAENGAVVWTPATKQLEVLGEPPPRAFVEELHARGVEPLGVGSVIVATREPHERTVLEVIRSLGLELHVELNKGAVMVLPAGITKRAGLAVALAHARMSPRNVVAVGDAENDQALLAMCQYRVAVANAVPRLAEGADWVTPSADGAGVVELVDRLLADDP